MTATVLVTGGCRGIGAGITRNLAAAGLNVVATHRTGNAPDPSTFDGTPPGCIVPLPVDLDDPGLDHEHLVRQVAGTFTTPLAHLVNCAALVGTEPLADLTADTMITTLRVNVVAPLLLIRALVRLRNDVPGLRSVVNVSSISERFRGPDSIIYEASKAALSHITRGLAKDLAPEGIRVNAVAPGAIHTERKAADPSWDPEFVGTLVPAGRVGSPQDVADVVAFLLTGESDYIIGQVIYVDGGITLRL